MHTSSFCPSVSVVIPTLNAGKDIDELLHGLSKQEYPISEIIVVDSSSSDDTVSICKKYEKARIFSISRKDFDHGKTRDMAVKICNADVVVFMTQDAVPADSGLIKNLIHPLSDTSVAVATARQLPKSDATAMECLIRSFNYPPESCIRTKKDIPTLGIKTFFCSDVCAAYNKKVYLELGGFDYPIKTNEDMFFAAKAIGRGYGIAYQADARVYHSHNFTLKQ